MLSRLNAMNEVSLQSRFRTPSLATPKWFAMSAPYRREQRARDIFIQAGLECFLPMRYQLVDAGRGKKKRELRPAVPNLIFVKARRDDLQRVKSASGIVQYLTRPDGERNIPITVPDAQMDDFRRAIQHSLDNYIYLSPSEIDIAKGRKVRIIGGQLNGLEGVFMKVKGARSRRLVIMLDGLGAVAAEVNPDFIELL